MKTINLLILTVLFFNLSCSNFDNNIETLNNKLSELKNKYAPDLRTAVFNYKLEHENQTYNLFIETDKPKLLSDIEKYIGENNINIKTKFNLLPDKELKDKIYGIVNLSVANLRTKPKHSAEMATQALLGTVVKILKRENSWLMVQTPDKYIAWIEDEIVTNVNADDLKKYLSSDKIIFTDDFGFSYSKQNSKSERVSDLVIGDIIKVTKEFKKFYEVEYPEGKPAYVPKQKSSLFKEWLQSQNVTPANIISTAKMFLGVPYLWGGTSIKGFDCSGFTKTVYFLNNVILPRDASQQALVGDFVDSVISLRRFKTGDLLFFGRKAKGNKPAKVTHVGIYMGNGKFIHASGRVKINSLKKEDSDFNSYRYNSFILARRILSSVNKNNVQSILSNKYY